MASATQPAIPTSPAATSQTPSATAQPPGNTFDGTYTIALAPGDDACGTPSINGLSLTINGDVATLTAPGGELLHGTARQASGQLAVHLTRAQGNPWSVDLSGDLDGGGNIRGQSKNEGIYPGGQQGFSCDFPFTGNRTLAHSSLATPDGATDRLRAAIAAFLPGIGFDPECVAQGTQECATGSWSDAMLASGIASVSAHNAQDGVATFYGRQADGTWVFWFGTQNSGGPQVLLPGDMIVCAQGEGLNLRSGPSTSAPVVTLIRDGTVVRGDSFVMTDPPSPGGAGRPHPDGWYHITSPQEGWAYDRYLLGVAPGVQTCIKTWWP